MGDKKRKILRSSAHRGSQPHRSRTAGSRYRKEQGLEKRSLTLLLGRRDPEAVKPIAIAPVADAKALPIEDPDTHAKAVRVHVVRADVDPFEQALLRRAEDQHDGVHHPASRQHLLILAKERGLLVPVLVRRVRNRDLADQSPRHPFGALGELFDVVPRAFIRIEQAALHALADVDDREADVGHEDVRIAARTKGRLIERDVRERRLRLRTNETEDLGHLGDAEEVVAHDAASSLVALGLLERGRRDDHLDDAPEGIGGLFECEDLAHEPASRQLPEIRDLRTLRKKGDEPAATPRRLLVASEENALDLRLADRGCGLDVGHGTSHPQVRLENSLRHPVRSPFG